MKMPLIRGYKSILRDFKSGMILNKIGSGKRVFFEDPEEGMVFKYIPGEIGRLSKYYVKQYGRNEYEIDSESSSILIAILKGKPISKTRYDSYRFIGGRSWDSVPLTASATKKAMGA